MRANYQIKKFGHTLFIMLAHTQTLEGVTSLIPNSNNLHMPFFDIERSNSTSNCLLNKAENELRKLQSKYWLSDIFITSDKEGSYRAWCFSQVKFTDYLRMMLDLIDVGILDYNFFWWTVNKSKATLRVNNKVNRPKQEIISVLKSYPVPIPEKCERVVYDTGIEKRGLTVFLGNGGKIIHG